MWSPLRLLVSADQPIRELVVKSLQNLLSTTIKCSFVTVTASPSASSNHNGSITPRLDMATEAVHITECQGLSSTSPGVCSCQNPLLLLSTFPESNKRASKLNQTFSKYSGSSSILFLDHRHITAHFSMSTGVSFYFIGMLYGYRWRSLIKILCNEGHEMKDPFLV